MQSRKLLDNSAYHTVYKTIKNRLAAKGERPDASEDPLKNTAGEVMTSRDILRVCQHLMNSNSTAADRDLSLNNWLLSTCGSLMAERMLNFESLLLDVVEAVQSGKRADVLDAPAMRRMQLAQQQQLVIDQEAQHGELERVLEIADRERADRGAQGAEDDETDAGGNLSQRQV